MLDKVTEKTLQGLLSGRHPQSKEYGGKQVFVIRDEVIPLESGKKGISDFKKLKEKYGRSPVLTFVPHPGVSYILISR